MVSFLVTLYKLSIVNRLLQFKKNKKNKNKIVAIKKTTTSTVSDVIFPLRQLSTNVSEESLSNIFLKKIVHHHRDMYYIISQIKIDNDNLVGEFKDYKDCDEFLDLHFTHLELDTNNIFTPNDPTSFLLPGLFLRVNAYRQLIF